MRTGCLLHLDKYAGMGQHYNVQDIQRVKEEVSKLRPVEHCKVIAIGYRRYVTVCQGHLNKLSPAHNVAGMALTRLQTLLATSQQFTFA